MIQNILLGLQIISALALTVAVLLQQKGSGVGGVFGGEATLYRSRRGVAKILHYATIISALLLGIISLVSVLNPFR